MMEYASEIVNLGFAVFVAAFLLIRLDKTLDKLAGAIKSFRKLVETTNQIAGENVEITEQHNEALHQHDRSVHSKLDRLDQELGKVKKRNERGD